MMDNNKKALNEEQLQEELAKAKEYLASANHDRQKKGFQLLLELADENIAEALFLVGQCYYEGIVTPKNIDNAEDYLQEAADNNHSEAKLLLGKIYSASSSPLRQRKMLKLYKSAAEDGIPEAMFLYALQMLKQDRYDEEALALMHEAAVKNNPAAQTFVGLSEDLQGNFNEACKYYQKAAKHNNTLSSRILADRYMYDEIEPDKKQKETLGYEEHIAQMHRAALKLYKKAAENGDLESQFRCAIFERDGIYDRRSPNKEKAIEELFLSLYNYYEPALYCLKKLAAKDNWSKYLGAYAQQQIKWLEERLACSQADVAFGTEEAFAIYDKLAPINGYARYKRALCLYYGHGVAQNVYKAVEALEKITERPDTRYNALAHYLLSYYYIFDRIASIEANESLRENEKRDKIADYEKKALLSHRKALNNICKIFRTEKDFYKAIREELHAEALGNRIAEITNKYELEDDHAEDDSEDMPTQASLLDATEGKELLKDFLTSLKKRIHYYNFSSSAYAKYCKGDRDVSYEMLQYIALAAELTVEECKTLYLRAGRIFSPLTFYNDYLLKKVLSGEYINQLSENDLEYLAVIDKLFKNELVEPRLLAKLKIREVDNPPSKLEAAFKLLNDHCTAARMNKIRLS